MLPTPYLTARDNCPLYKTEGNMPFAPDRWLCSEQCELRVAGPECQGYVPMRCDEPSALPEKASE